MTTTDQSLQLSTYEKYLSKCDTHLNLNLYKLPYIADFEASIIAIACIEEYSKLNGVNGIEYKKLSKKFRIKLSNLFDAYHRFHPVLMPGEKIKKATLYQACVKAKPEFENDKNWIYDEEKLIKSYVPIKTVTNISGPFSFYDIPIFMSPYIPLSIEIEYETIKYKSVTIGIESITLQHKIRKNMHNIYIRIYGDPKLDIEPTEEDINKVLELMRACPVCIEKGMEYTHITTCNCTQRDSKCSNGHTWYYNEKENKIEIGKAKH